MREYLLAFPQAEIVVVDNGCEEDTASFARAAGAEVMTERRRGKRLRSRPRWRRSIPSTS